jgi:hypothetical protein
VEAHSAQNSAKVLLTHTRFLLRYAFSALAPARSVTPRAGRMADAERLQALLCALSQARNTRRVNHARRAPC